MPAALTGAALDQAVAETLGWKRYYPRYRNGSNRYWLPEQDSEQDIPVDLPAFSGNMAAAWRIVAWLREQPIGIAWAFEDALTDLVRARITDQPHSPAWLWASPADLCAALLAVAGPEEEPA